MLVIIALVALRLAVGWHFFVEGAKKFTDPDFSAASFLRIAKGPMADFYMGMIPDPYGEQRLSREELQEDLSEYREKVLGRYDVDEETQEKAEKLTEEYMDRFDAFYAENQEDIEKFFIRLEHWKEAKGRQLRFVPFRHDWIQKEGMELRTMAAPWLQTVRQLREDYREDLLELVLPEGKEITSDVMPMPKVTAMPVVDSMVKWTVILVGIGLLLGLFTRLWCFIGVGFLLSVITSQWPGAMGADMNFIYYQVVEIFALGVLFFTAAGRYAGLDFFVHAGIQKLTNRGAKSQTEPAPTT